MSFSIPIEPVQNLGGEQSFYTRRIIEESGQTAPYGTPVQVNSSDGGLQAWPGTVYSDSLAGFLAEGSGFSNLSTTGSGAPQGLTPVLGPGSVIGNYPANPNEPLAVITPALVPINDGRAAFYVAFPGSVFVGVVGDAGVAIATTNQMVGASYGLTKDPVNAYWYVDTSKTGSDAVVQIVQLDPRDAVGTVGGRLFFVVLNSAAQVIA